MAFLQTMLTKIVEEFYLCMNCGKKSEENPKICGKPVHSKFSEKYNCTYSYDKKKQIMKRSSDIGNWLFKFQVGQYDESLKGIPHFLGQTPKYELAKIGFSTIGDYSAMTGKIYEKAQEKMKKELIKHMEQLNEKGKNYLLFQVSSFPGVTHYTIMEKEKKNT
jgi:hypothetical protein